MGINRRIFLKKSGMALASAAMMPAVFSCSKSEKSDSPIKNIGIQLFTLADLLNKDAQNVIEQIAKIGYKHVETFGVDTTNSSFWGLPVQDLKKILDDNDLKSYSGHYDLSNYLTKNSPNKENLEKYLEIAHNLGQKYVVAPVTPMTFINKYTQSDYQYFAEQLNVAGDMAKKAGIKIGYHNHFWEFKEFGNRTKGLDILIAFTEPELVDFEMDLFWAFKAGVNPVDYFEKYPNRFPLWHIKDMDRNASQPLDLNKINPQTHKQDSISFMDIFKEIRYAEVGSGSIDFKQVIQQGEQPAGLQYAFVEQDQIYSNDKFASIRKSYDYVQKHLAQ